MFPSPTRCLWLSSLVGLLLACARPYAALRAVPGDAACVQRFRPTFRNELYKAQIDIVGRSLGGLLLIKTMPDRSTRVVFTSETGPTFFDFEFAPDGAFHVRYVLDRLNRRPVLTALRSDFELVLMRNLTPETATLLADDSLRYARFPSVKGAVYVVTDAACTHLRRIEKMGKRKPLVRVWLRNYRQGVPDSIGISHQNFKFEIGLKRLAR